MKSAFVRRARSRYSSARAAFSRSSRLAFGSSTSSSTSGILSSPAMVPTSLLLGLELRVDYLFAGGARPRRGRLLRLRGRRFIELLREVLRGGLERGHGLPDLLGAVRALHPLEAVERLLDRFLGAAGDLVAVLAQQLLGGVDGVIRLVARLRQLLALPVAVGHLLGLPDHLLDLLLVEAGSGGDADLLLLPGALVLRRHVEDAVGVDVELDV